MAYAFHLVKERSGVRTDPEGTAWLAVVYALDSPLPSGVRQKLVPALHRGLEERDQELLAVDLFDEFIRVHVPLDASAPAVEEALREALAQIDLPPSPPSAVSEEARGALERYFQASRHRSSA